MADLTARGTRLGKYMGMGAIFFAPIFLFNPVISVIDVFPDFLGYLLITLGLRRMRDLSVHFESAWKNFRILIPVSLLKFLSLFWIFGILDSAQERPTMLLLASFCFCILELIWGIPAWRALFSGITYHCQSVGGDFAIGKKAVLASFARGFTQFFIVAEAFFANISELSVLSSHTYDDTAFDWYEYIGLFRTFALLFGLILGVIWLAVIMTYFSAMRRDRAFFDSAAEKYRLEVLPNTGLFIRRDISFTLAIIAIGALISADIYVDLVNVLPDTLSAVFFLWAFIKMKPYYDKYKIGIAISSVYAVFSAWGATSAYIFRDSHSMRQVWTNTKVFTDFFKMYPVRVAENIVFVVTVVFSLCAVRAVIKTHCGYLPATMDESYRASRLSAIVKELSVKVWITLAIAVVSAICAALYEIMITFPDTVIGGAWWLISFVCSFVFFASTLMMNSAVNEEVESRYMLD